MTRLPIFGLLFLAACSSDPEVDASANDVGFADSGVDAGVADSGPDTGTTTDTGFDGGFEADAEPIDALPDDTGVVDAGPFTITSPAFQEGGTFPPRHTCNGIDVQPELAWTGVPAGTQSFALVLIDESFNFVHWVAYDLPGDTVALAEGASDDGTLPNGTREARAYGIQYRGPCPPNGPNTYTFRLYALSAAMTTYNFPNGVDSGDLMSAFNANTIDMATLTGTYRQ
jgi:Raf kinase inhibitor-like YbhB/YbcL family protein